MKKRRSGKNNALLLTAVVCAFSAVIFTLIALSPAERLKSSAGSDTVNELYFDLPDTEALGFPDGDVIFRIKDTETLYMLAETDAFGEYFRLHGEEPIVVADGDLILDRTVEISGGIRLIIAGSLSWTDDDTKIRIRAEGKHTITVSGNEPLTRFDIDAPDSALNMDGGDIPFLHEVACTQNVSSYNGTPTAGAADGDTLGGRGRGTAESVTLYTNSKKTSVWDGAYSCVDGNLITLYVPHDVSDRDIKKLSVSVNANGGQCHTPDALDLTSPALIDVTDTDGESRTYRLSVERTRFDIPILAIYTDDGAGITSNEVYKTGRMILDGKEYTLSVKGRGNSSWRTFPKRSYRIKLDSKAKLCGMKADRDWCLIGNYVDPSLLRNKVASDMAMTMTGLPFTPKYKSVDLFINGDYVGIFMLSEKIEDNDDRVPLGERVTDERGKISDMGFLIEFGWDYYSENIYAKDYFDTSYCKRMYIKEPDIVKAHSPEYNYVYKYVKAAEDAIVRRSGYEDYIDVDSWVDWFIFNELTFNSECAFFRSLYMYKPVGGKLTAGPVWDYDMAFGNNLIDIPGYDGWASVDFVYKYMYDNWMMFLVKDETFMSRVRARWAEIKEPLMATALASVEVGAAEIEASQKYNFSIWPKALLYQIGMSRASTLGFTTWREHVDYIGEFLRMRYEWMDKQLS